jgi:hypothetical protein
LQYLAFLSNSGSPGYVLLLSSSSNDTSFSVGDIFGYSIGEPTSTSSHLEAEEAMSAANATEEASIASSVRGTTSADAASAMMAPVRVPSLALGQSVSSAGPDNSSTLNPLVDAEAMHPPAFEIIAAWVSPELKGLGMSQRLYSAHLLGLCRSSGSGVLNACLGQPSHAEVCFDVISGGFEKIVASNLAYRFAAAIGVHQLFITRRARSYSVHTQGGNDEHFERFFMSTRRIVLVIKILEFVDKWLVPALAKLRKLLRLRRLA